MVSELNEALHRDWLLRMRCAKSPADDLEAEAIYNNLAFSLIEAAPLHLKRCADDFSDRGPSLKLAVYDHFFKKLSQN